MTTHARAARPAWFWPVIVALAALPIGTALILYIGARGSASSAPPSSLALATAATDHTPDATPEVVVAARDEDTSLVLEDTTVAAGEPEVDAGAEDVAAIAGVAPEVQQETSPAKASTTTGTTTPTVTAAGHGELSVRARPWALVSVDGQAMGMTPRVLQLKPGRHRVTFTRGQDSATRYVSITPGRSVVVEHDFGQ